MHDQKRVSLSGKGTYQKILQNLKEIKQCNKEYRILLRNNILRNQLDVNYYDELATFIARDSRFEVLLREVGNWGGNNEIKSLDVLSGLEEKQKNLYEHFSYLADKRIKIRNFEEGLPLSSTCYASYKNSYVFRANGDICKCTVHFDLPENQIGKIVDENTIYWSEENLNYWLIDFLAEKCYACKQILSCFNKACPIKARKNVISCSRTKMYEREQG